MQLGRLAAKKYWITGIIVVLVLAGAYGAYRIIDQKHTAQKTRLGGEVEIASDKELPLPEITFVMNNRERIAYAVDAVTDLPLSKGMIRANVRAFDGRYPLYGKIGVKRQQFKHVFIHDKSRGYYGVAVNDAFLKRSNTKIGDFFTMNKKAFQIRAIVTSLPDMPQETINSVPLLLVRNEHMRGSGMVHYAHTKTFRYRLDVKSGSAEKFVENYKAQFPQSAATLTAWSQ